MRRILVVSTVLAVTAVGLAPSVTASPTSSPAHAGASASSVPTITPTPQQVDDRGARLTVPRVARLVAGAEVDEPTLSTVEASLRDAGVTRIVREEPGGPPRGPFTVTVGEPARTPAVGERLEDLGADGPGSPGRRAGIATPFTVEACLITRPCCRIDGT